LGIRAKANAVKVGKVSRCLSDEFPQSFRRIDAVLRDDGVSLSSPESNTRCHAVRKATLSPEQGDGSGAKATQSPRKVTLLGRKATVSGDFALERVNLSTPPPRTAER